MRLIIPDIHNKVGQLNYLLTKYKHIKEKTSLGDWYDSFEDNTARGAEETAKAQSDFISDPNHTCLYGNHDIGYAFPNCLELTCSGWGAWKQKSIDKWMKCNWDKVRLFQWLELNGKKWLLSHAGFHSEFIDSNTTELEINIKCDDALFSVKRFDTITNILSAGRRRGGTHPVGGCTWLDWRDFKPTPGINQIVGHTISDIVREFKTDTSENYCIDTQLRHVALLDDDGTCTIEEI